MLPLNIWYYNTFQLLGALEKFTHLSQTLIHTTLLFAVIGNFFLVNQELLLFIAVLLFHVLPCICTFKALLFEYIGFMIIGGGVYKKTHN